MPKIAYKECNFRAATLNLIETCNQIIREYQADGLKLTLRQLYYQLVSRDVIPNTIKEYNRLGNTVNDGRLAGLIDWDAIEDRTRNLQSIGHWTNPSDIIGACANSFRIDKWKEQPYRTEVWIEKEALAGVFDRICQQLDVPFLSCRGYTSQSEMWAAAMRFVRYLNAGQSVHVFHFGDHDPSGIDMTRDIEDRLKMFIARHSKRVRNFSLTRVALNMDQVEQYTPPENPAKTTDTRFQSYMEKFGESSWELDALNPRVLTALVVKHIQSIRDETKWAVAVEEESQHRATLQVMSDNWTDIENYTDEHWSSDIAEEKASQIDAASVDEEDVEPES